MSRIAKLAATVLLVVSTILVALMVLLPAALGLQRYVIVGGSMTGTIDKGSVVYAKTVPIAQLKVGDIVTFVPPGLAEPVTHRIVAIATAQDRTLVFQTKGDFNTAGDPWQSAFLQDSVARYSFHVPYVGYLLGLLAIRAVRMVVIGLPALLIAMFLLGGLWRSAGIEARRCELEDSNIAVASSEEA